MDHAPWFEAFRKYNGNFAFGLHEITAKEEFVRGLLELRSSAEDVAEESILGNIRARKIGKTTREALIKARVGQGPFRDAVIKIEMRCRVTRVTNPDYLIASHCKPWSDSSDEERLDGNNGLLLSPNIDHLFDGGMISFSNEGDMRISKWADMEALLRLGVETEHVVNVGAFIPPQVKYLTHHRQYVFEKR
jgi:predicted restriction endonuclease